MKQSSIIEAIQSLDPDHLLNIPTHIVCNDIEKYIYQQNEELTLIDNIEARTALFSDLILFLYQAKSLFEAKLKIYKTNLYQLYESNLYPILQQHNQPLVLPEKILKDIENYYQYTRINLIEFIDYNEQFILSWSGNNTINLDVMSKQIEERLNLLKYKIEAYERELYTNNNSVEKISLHINFTQRAIRDRKNLELDTEQLKSSLEHYELLKEEIELQTQLNQPTVKEHLFEINKEDFGYYFKSSFKGSGNGSFDYFSTLVDELKLKRSNKELAQIALLIYESDKMNQRKPNTFAEWYTLFCRNIGCQQKKYDKNKLRNPSENLKKVFFYL